MISTFSLDELPQIKEFWKMFSRELGVYTDKYCLDLINNNALFKYEENGKLIGFAGYVVHNRNRQVECTIIAVLPEYQGHGISLKLLKHIYQENISLIETLGYPLITLAYEGLPNNKYYEHISYHAEYPTKHTEHTTIKYFIDLSRLR